MANTKMTIEDLKSVSTKFFYHWYNAQGNNTYQGFDSWIKDVNLRIITFLDTVDINYAHRIQTIADNIDLSKEVTRLLLRELKAQGVVSIMMVWNDATGLPCGSGYRLTEMGRDQAKAMRDERIQKI